MADQEINDFSFSLEFPPSVNSCYNAFRGRLILNKVGKDYCASVLETLSNDEDVFHFRLSRLAVHIVTYAPTKREYDLDNRQKILLDAIEKTELVFDDDTQIDDLHIVRGDIVGPNEACVDITIQRIKRKWKDARTT